MTTFRDWQHIRWSGVQHKESASEAEVRKITAPATKPEKDK